MDRKRLREIFFETDILQWVGWLGLPKLEVRANFHSKRTLLHQLSLCVSAGIDLPRSLDMCLKGRYPHRMRSALEKAMQALADEGLYLSEALRRHAPRLFPRPFYGIIEVGEKSGTLADTLKILDRQYESRFSTRRQISAVLVYPCMLLLTSLGVMSFLLLKVVPAYREIIADMGREAPSTTQALFLFNDWIRSHIPIVVIAIAGMISIIFLFVFLARRVLPFYRILLGIPFFGSMIRHAHMFQFSSLMSVILKSGAPTHDALVLCQSEALWPVLKDVVKKVELDVAEGGLFSEALAIRGVFSRTFLWLASIGEQRGDLGDSLRAAAEFERERIRDGVVMLGSWFEPALVTLTSVGIGFLVIALGPSLAFFT